MSDYIFYGKLLYADFANKKELGEGSFNKVYLAKHSAFPRDHLCVLKVANSEYESNGNKRITEKLEKEAVAISTINHLHIVSLLAYVIDHRKICLVYEYSPYGSLSDIACKNISFRWGMKKKVALDTTKGICYLHDKGLLHRNLKCSNILLFEDNLVKVGDFFLIHQETWMSQAGYQRDVTEKRRIANEDRRPTRSNGTLIAHVPPETIKDITRKPTSSYDSYSFGVALLSLIEGIQLYSGKSTEEVFKIVNENKVVHIGEKKADCPQILWDHMKACLFNTAQHRPTFHDMRESFSKMCSDCQTEIQQDFDKFVQDHNDYDTTGHLPSQPQQHPEYVGRTFYESQAIVKDPVQVEDNNVATTSMTGHYSHQHSVQPTVKPSHPEEEIEEQPIIHSGSPQQVKNKAIPFNDDPPLVDVNQQQQNNVEQPHPQVVIQAGTANVYGSQEQDNLPVRTPATEIPLIRARTSLRKMVVHDVNVVASNIGANWKLLARNMGVDELRINVIDYNYEKDGVYEKVYQAIRDWEGRKNGDVKICELVDMLCMSNLQAVANRLEY